MISKVTIAGIPVLIVGLILLIVFTFIGVIVSPFGVRTNVNYGTSLSDQIIIGSGLAETIDLHLEGLPSHPTQVFIKARFIILSAGSYECNIQLLFSGNVEGTISGDLRRISGSESEDRSISGTVPMGYSSQSYSIKLQLENVGSNSITIAQRLIELRLSLYGTYIPMVLCVIGIVLIILGFTVLKGGPSVPKRKAIAPGGWEPTLQWGSGSSSSTETTQKKPRMAIKSTKAPKPAQKQVVKKVVPTGGAQQSCKFCGKSVPAAAFFCPHCYGKLR